MYFARAAQLIGSVYLFALSLIGPDAGKEVRKSQLNQAANSFTLADMASLAPQQSLKGCDFTVMISGRLDYELCVGKSTFNVGKRPRKCFRLITEITKSNTNFDDSACSGCCGTGLQERWDCAESAGRHRSGVDRDLRLVNSEICLTGTSKFVAPRRYICMNSPET